MNIEWFARNPKALAILVGLVFVIGIYPIRSLRADNEFESIKDKVVKITTTFEDGSWIRGFGFALRETADSLDIVTASTVVMSELGERTVRIQVDFFRSDPTIAILVNAAPSLDLALLRVKKPTGIVWTDLYRAKKVIRNDKVWIVGRDWTWSSSPLDFVGQVADVVGIEVKIDFYGVEGGPPGGPVIATKGGGIAGIIVNDAGHQITALSADVIKRLVYKEWLGIKLPKRYDFPFFGLGLSTGLHGPATRSDAGKNMQIFNPPNYGFFVDGALWQSIWLRFERKLNSMQSVLRRFNGMDFQFRNHFTTNTVSLVLRGDSDIHMGDGQYGGLGYSMLSMKPELSIDGGDWTALRDTEGFEHDYSTRTHSFHLEVGWLAASPSHLMVGFDMALIYSRTKYLYIDVASPFERNKQNDWLITVGLKVSYIIHNHKPGEHLLQ